MRLLDEPVISGHDAADGGEEDGIAAHESQERLRGAQDLPRHEHPAGDNGRDHAAALDVDPAREQDRQVVGGRDGVGGDVGADLGDVPRQGGEEGGAPAAAAHVQPQRDDVEGVPHVLAGEDLGSRGGHDTEDAAQGEDDGEEGQLDELALGRACVTGEIRDVAGKGGPGAGDGRHATEPEPGVCRTVDLGAQVPDITAAAGPVKTPSHRGNGSNGSADQLDDEDGPELGRVDEQQRQLDYPEEEVAAHALGVDGGGCGQVVGDVVVGRGNRTQHDGDALCTVGALDTEPEHGQDGAGYDAKVPQVVTKAAGGNDGEGDVELCADSTVQNHGDCDTEGADHHDRESLSP